MTERRRGRDLERAILGAAWLELADHGYAGLTMDGVAKRAGTSRPVLARRWEGKAELAVATIRHQMAKHPLDVPDSGNVRTELIDYLERASARASGIAAAFTLFHSEYFSEGSSAPKDLHEALARGETRSLSLILDRAVGRRQVDPDKLTPPVASLLGDLFRYHVVMHFKPPPQALRQDWVDTIFLPLVRSERSHIAAR
ncbi:TetR/AcrR family transcriptional regulator [Jiella pacifica]|uniref:TetR/AcrR family transcriptional regulator n=1 Tax=Jiella pacifica TaxID=2696469 RepID=UPI0019402ECC|nr:TetR/AcrR family transcriptional regulator [Jiella pacifica]